jgi:hypothetical protein
MQNFCDHHFVAKGGMDMKRIGVALLGTAALLGASPVPAPKKTFHGEIMDTQCAKMGSHDVMMKKEGARSTAECARDCFKMGGKYVLYDAVKKSTYDLDDQKNLEPFAGQTVDVTGTYDGYANIIHVLEIERMVSPSSSATK